jgi:hypothetical protein
MARNRGEIVPQDPIQEGLRLANEERPDIERLQAYGAALSSAADLAQSMRAIVECARDIVQIRCEYELHMRRLELAYARSAQRSSQDGATIRKMIERLADQTDKVLDNALSIRPAPGDVRAMEHRAQLLETANAFSERMNNALLRFIAM